VESVYLTAVLAPLAAAIAGHGQHLAPGESRDMGVQFFVDPDLLKDPSTSDVRTITTSSYLAGRWK